MNWFYFMWLLIGLYTKFLMLLFSGTFENVCNEWGLLKPENTCLFKLVRKTIAPAHLAAPCLGNTRDEECPGLVVMHRTEDYWMGLWPGSLGNIEWRFKDDLAIFGEGVEGDVNDTFESDNCLVYCYLEGGSWWATLIQYLSEGIKWILQLWKLFGEIMYLLTW